LIVLSSDAHFSCGIASHSALELENLALLRHQIGVWARMLAYITGTVDQELLLRNEYLAAENRILRAQIKGRLLLSDAEKATLAEIAHRLGRKALEELAAVAKPDTLLAWYRKLIATKFDGSKFRKSWGRPRVDEETERLVVRMAKENPGWGYDRIVGAMANLGLRLSDQTVGNILRRHDIPPARKRKQATSWKDFIRAQMAVLVAPDFFTVEVLTLRGLITYYVLFFIHWRARGYAWPESHVIRIKSGWNRWRAM
jgi:putative transposase